MSYPAFIAKSLGISFGVYMRFVPLYLFALFFFVALFLTTSQYLVHMIILFFALTVGWTYLYLMLLRGGLYALKATTPANVDGTMVGVVKLMFVHFLAQLLLVSVVVAGTYLFLYKFSLPQLAPAAYQAMQEGASIYSPEVMGETGTVYFIFQLIGTVAAITATSLFGAPMAAVAANTAEISPNVDIITGFGRYFPHQFTLSLISVVAPAALLGLMMPTLIENALTASTGAIVITVVVILLIWGYLCWAIPVSGMALAFKLVRDEMAIEREMEAHPVFDKEEHKQSLREMRAQRQGGKTNSVYDPKA